MIGDKKTVVNEIVVNEDLAERVKFARKRISMPIEVRVWQDKVKKYREEMLQNSIIHMLPDGRKLVSVYPPIFERKIDKSV